MRVVGLARAFYHVARHPPTDLSPRAAVRLRFLSCWQALRGQGLSSGAASEVLELPRATLYRWRRRREAQGPGGQESTPQTAPAAHLEPGAGPGGLAVAGTVPPLGQG